MNVQNKRLMTAAEQALVDGYFDRAAEIPGNDRIAALRSGMIEDIRQNGLPSRRTEAWHYTDLRTLLKTVPAARSGPAPQVVDPLVAGSTIVSVFNGHTAALDLPSGVSQSRFRDALLTGEAAMRLVARDDDDIIGRINGTYVTDGLVLSFDEGAKPDDILELQVLHGGGQEHTRFPVTIGAGANGTVVERHVAAGQQEALVSSITDLHVGRGADIVWLISQEQGLSDTHFGQINIRLDAEVKLTLFISNAGGQLVRQEIHVTASGEGSELILRGVNLLGGSSHTDVTMTLDHLVPDCGSTQTFRNVVFDRARGVFQGQIRVAKIAQKTDARMACNTLLLSDAGEFSSKPELEIFADDVQCDHGATVADINDDHLFYLMARGIGEKKARAMLVKAFIAEIVEELEDEALIEALEARFEAWLDHHG